MDINKLKIHVKLCKKNLKSSRVKCCANCPFEEEITKHYSELSTLFMNKREKYSERLGRCLSGICKEYF